jgi:DNA-binding CsgD family transcriptional regulator
MLLGWSVWGVGPKLGERAGLIVLRGRSHECAALDRLLNALRSSESGVLVIRGDAGVGKSALLEYASTRGAGLRVARAIGVESEMEFAFAGLHQLCAPFLDRLDVLPAPQRDAVETAFGLSSGVPPDRLFLGLAVLGLFSQVGAQEPLLCVVDDAQWLDQSSAEVLAFVARRLRADSVALLFATRPSSDLDVFAGLPGLRLEGLRAPEARELLREVVRGPLDERVADRIVAETAGNPLALLELPRGLAAADLAAGFGSAGTLQVSHLVESSFLQRVRALPAETQTLLVIAAAEPTGDPATLWRAGGLLGIGTDAAAAAKTDGLLDIGTHVRFRHPLLRSAVYRHAPGELRRAAHRALAEVTDADVDPDRRVWHRAQAVAGADEMVAEELEHSAERAKARGGLAATAAFLERAATLTADPTLKARRALAGAEAKHAAGAHDAALELLALAEAGPLDERQNARAEWLRADILSVQSPGGDAEPARLLLSAANRLDAFDPALAQHAYIHAVISAKYSGTAEARAMLEEMLRRREAARTPLSAPPRRASELFLTGWALLLTQGFPAGTDLLRDAMRAFRDDPQPDEQEIRGLWQGALDVAKALWDDESWYVLATRWVEHAREAGALPALAAALRALADLHVDAGDFAAAVPVLAEANAIREATGAEPIHSPEVLLEAWRESETTALRRIAICLQDATARNDSDDMEVAEWAHAVLYNGLGRYRAAVMAAQRACDHHPRRGSGLVLAELVEAAVRAGDHEHAKAALERLVERTQLAGTDWALGVEARSRGLLSSGDVAEHRYEEAIQRLSRTRMRSQLARARLVYGEWLRRERRRFDAREQLRMAHEMLDDIGARTFAERAARELRATGGTVRKRSIERSDQLTAQEEQIAQLAREGLSNAAIGIRLFISPRTVEYHLHKVFAKLGITSRTQLEQALSSEVREAQPV